MKYIRNLAFALVLCASVSGVGFAQSEEEDPLAGFDELLNEIESAENMEEIEPDMGTEGETAEFTEEAAEDSVEEVEGELDASPESETTESSETEETAEVEETLGKTVGNRLLPKDIPEGKENHLLYNVPGAIDYRGMTFLRIDSPKFFNRFQKCDTTEANKTYNALARLKISQGAPLECRESMKYQFIPYKTFRGMR